MEPPSRGGSPDCSPGTTASSRSGKPNGKTRHRRTSCRPGGRDRTRRPRLVDRSGLNSPVRSDTSPSTIPIRYRACHKVPTDSADSCRLWQCQRMCHHQVNNLIRHWTSIARPRPYSGKYPCWSNSSQSSKQSWFPPGRRIPIALSRQVEVQTGFVCSRPVKESASTAYARPAGAGATSTNVVVTTCPPGGHRVRC